ncbi:MAG: hypothetical protein Q8P62_04610 [Candidatus Peregrinibacteria bacterium]|nr:hypothetical protein [Candidatus Peregrinibacteria bacterium]
MAQAYQTKASILSGTDFREVQKKALAIYAKIKRRSKRIPYVRSAYFQKDKIFLPLFWQHLWDKEKWQDRMRRLKYYASAIELIHHNKFAPKSKENPNKTSEILHRFTGITKENYIFYVQIKENKKSGRKDLISIFPEK